MMCGLKTVALIKQQEIELLQVAEMKILRFSEGVTRFDKIINERIRGNTQVGRFGGKVKESRLAFGCVQGRDKEYRGRRMLKTVPPGNRHMG